MKWQRQRDESVELPGSQEKEHFDERSTERLQPLFFHERAASKCQEEAMNL